MLAPLVAVHDPSMHHKRSPQQARDLPDIAAGKGLPNDRAADDLTIDQLRGEDLHPEAHIVAHLVQRKGISFSSLPQRKIGANDQSPHPEMLLQQTDKIAGRNLGQFEVEGQRHHQRNAHLLDRSDSIVQRHQPVQGSFRRHDVLRMATEGDHAGEAIFGQRPPLEILHEALVANVDPVEDADGEHSVTLRREFLELFLDFHAFFCLLPAMVRPTALATGATLFIRSWK